MPHSSHVISESRSVPFSTPFSTPEFQGSALLPKVRLTSNSIGVSRSSEGGSGPQPGHAESEVAGNVEYDELLI